jgi:uncharacterized damage-inducible protein DinB
MLQTVRDLIAHKGFADRTLSAAIGDNPAAVADRNLRAKLEHMLLANRFWLLTILARQFVHEEEARPAASFEALMAAYRMTHEQELEWVSRVTEGELLRILEDPLIPAGGRCTVLQAVLQVCMHSQGHRAQCATLLRNHGSVPPATDFILWLAGRPVA